MKVIVAGSRSINNSVLVDGILTGASTIFTINEVVTGGARGVDRIAERWAYDNRIPCKVFYADWDKHGRAAGIIRNTEMVDYADALIAIWNSSSRGTADIIGRAKSAGLPVLRIVVTLYGSNG